MNLFLISMHIQKELGMAQMDQQELERREGVMVSWLVAYCGPSIGMGSNTKISHLMLLLRINASEDWQRNTLTRTVQWKF